MARKKRKKKMRGETKAGALYAVAAIGIVALFGTVMAGGIVPTITKLAVAPPPSQLYTCCDSGDGPDCHPIMEKTITYNGDTYALLKSDIAQLEDFHIQWTNNFAPDGHRIMINTSDTTADYSSGHGGHHTYAGCEHGKDLIALKDPSRPDLPCYGLQNDELIYVCKASNEECTKISNNAQIPFDVYYRIKDGPVPAEISTYCPKPEGTDPTSAASSQQQIVGLPTPGGRKNLQLEWFQVKQEKKLNKWLGAWCKPAINLYPTTETKVHVEVAPKGEFTYTMPSYPNNGWDVTASPNGTVSYKNATYPYLFWEASLPDNLIKEPKEGYVVAYNELSGLFNTVLPQMGLNDREKKQFTDYWLKALPKSPYYFVGVMPQNDINNLAPLTIQPTPDSILRVTLYFKALDNKINVTQPQLSGFTRQGFTVTEWGGFFKADKNHKDFTCLM